MGIKNLLLYLFIIHILSLDM